MKENEARLQEVEEDERRRSHYYPSRASDAMRRQEASFTVS